MPIIFYTKKDYDQLKVDMYQKAWVLARKLVEAKGFTCIKEPNAFDNYCDECPAEPECPYEWKEYSK